MKKVLIISTGGGIGGAQKYTNDLLEGIDKSKFEAELSIGGKDIKWLSNSFQPYFLFINDWLALLEMKKIFRERKPDVVHLNSSKAGVIGAIAAKLASKKIKVVFTAHGWVFNPDNHDSRFKKRFYVLLHRFAGKFQDVIINVSEFDRQLAIQYKIAPVEKLVTIRNGIDVNNAKFLDKKIARKALFEKFEIRNSKFEIAPPNGGVLLGSIGRLTKEKNYKSFVRVAKELLGFDNKLTFLIIGEGSERNNIETLIKKLGLQNNFFLLGEIPDAQKYLKAFDLFVLPSIKEGLPYTILESMHAGTPIVATNAGGIPEVLNGRGFLSPIRDDKSLVEEIKKALRDVPERERRVKNAKEYLEKELSLKNMIAKTERIYSRVD